MMPQLPVNATAAWRRPKSNGSKKTRRQRRFPTRYRRMTTAGRDQTQFINHRLTETRSFRHVDI
jgi:hypothetical protein